MNELNLPPEFISNVQSARHEDGRTYLDALPEQIAEASARWGLRMYSLFQIFHIILLRLRIAEINK